MVSCKARAVLIRRASVRSECCPSTPWVFLHIEKCRNTEVGDRIKDVKTAVRSACKRAGLTGVTFCTMCHTFASWLVMNGTLLFEVSKLLRHASIQMTERYAHLAPDHLQNAIANLGFSSQFHLTENLQQAVVYQNQFHKPLTYQALTPRKLT